MKSLLYWFYLLVCCGAAEGLTETWVDLGQNVTLECEVDVKDVFWFLMKPSEPPVYLLRSFSSKKRTPAYSNMTFSKTFSVQQNSSLFIHSISTNELGVYYCVQTGSPPVISSGIGLYIRDHSDESQTLETEQQSCEEAYVTETCLIISVILNVALAVAVTVFTVHRCRRSPKSQAQSDPGVQLGQDSPSPVYSEVQFITKNSPVRTKNLNSTYALLQPRTRDPD